MQHLDAAEKPQIWLADEDKRLKKSQESHLVDVIGDVDYGFGSVLG